MLRTTTLNNFYVFILECILQFQPNTISTGARSAAEVADCAEAAGLPGYSAAELARAQDAHGQDFPAA